MATVTSSSPGLGRVRRQDLPFDTDIGSVADGVTSDVVALQAQLNAAAANKRGVVKTRPNAIYNLGTTTLVKPTGVSLQMGAGSYLLYSGTGTAVQCLPGAPDDGAETYSDSVFQGYRKDRIAVKRATAEWSDGTDTTSVGIDLINQRYSQGEYYVSNFYIGLKLTGQDTGYAAGGAHVGNLYFVGLRNNKINCQTYVEGVTGYVNQNTFIGGYCRHDSGFVIGGTVHFDFTNGGNGNQWIGLNLEGDRTEKTFILNAINNIINGCRTEGNPAGSIQLLAGAQRTTIIAGYGETQIPTALLDDAAGSTTIISGFGIQAQNSLAANAALTQKLTGATGFWSRQIDSSNVVWGEADGGNKFFNYYSPGKYHATLNPSGHNNPSVQFSPVTRKVTFRSSAQDATSAADVASINWASPNSLGFNDCNIEFEDHAYNKSRLRFIATWFWKDTNHIFRSKTGTPASTTDGPMVANQNLLTLTPTQLTASVNNYAPGTFGFWRLSSDASRTITGITAGVDSDNITICNVGAQDIVLANESGSSTAANQIITGTGGDVTLTASKIIKLIYDATSARWRAMPL